MLLDGHYGASTTFAPNMVVDAGDGDPFGDGTYLKGSLGPSPHQGTVFMVAGSASYGQPPGADPLDHPAMIRAQAVLASVVITVDRDLLDVETLSNTGGLIDRFRIQKPAPPNECSDGLDNDADGWTDFPADPGCAASGSARENPACDDQVDNDGDGGVDLASDLGCETASSGNEAPQCQDGIDNDGLFGLDADGGVSIHGPCSLGTCPAGVSDPDGDGVPDPDPQCASFSDNREAVPGSSCGLGAELVLILPLLLAVRSAWKNRKTPELTRG
ncbi:MAG: hypothetical protein GY937_00680 [bacterium]|nr:hypothetical protein [bacterium]